MIIRLFILFTLFPLAVLCQVRLTDHTDFVVPDLHLYVLKSDGEVSPAEVVSLRENFVQNEGENPNLGFSKYSVWMALTVENRSQKPHYLLNVAYPLLDEVELYVADSSGTLNSIAHLGSFKEFHARLYSHPNYIFDINIPPSQSKEYYLRIKGAGQIILPISLSTSEYLWEQMGKINILVGIYLGVVLIMALYNFFLFLSVREIGYLYYVIYVTFLGLTQLGIVGFNFQFLWPDYPEWERMSVVLFACISGIAVLVFADRFLNFKKNVPFARWILLGVFFLFSSSFIAVVLGLTRFGFQVMQIATTIEAIVLLVLSLYLLRQKYRPAIYFFLAWSVLLIGALIFLLKDYGILPYTIFTSNSFRLASMIEMALLSFALAARINILKKEKDASQERELTISLENERLIREQNVILEQKVVERTQELTASNISLQKTLHHLRETQSQLVAAEKMASLGQLTAGVAHEINNPINFVTANVTPLKRDVNMIWDALEEVERIAFSEDLPAEEKQVRVQAYKEDLDIAYLRTEVDFLLKGMHDGAHRTAEIVKSLRVFSRMDENALTFADIQEGLDSTMVILNNLIREGVKVEKNYGNIPQIECHAGKLNQVFLNILTNAIYAINQRFKHQEGGVLKIETGISENPEQIFVRIADNGIGIPEHIRERIFDPFFTTKDVGEGTGLGMYISYNTIAEHDGEIKVESEEGVGTVFTLLIPIQQNRTKSGG